MEDKLLENITEITRTDRNHKEMLSRELINAVNKTIEDYYHRNNIGFISNRHIAGESAYDVSVYLGTVAKGFLSLDVGDYCAKFSSEFYKEE
jgi:hypothetical protein